ncbi:MAG: sulfite exporter TauE/SafE family protein [Acidimicrobiaceae bacterium]|nr:sulfite exporter TauE/SafE family protein [Acidimicrobiaceae bacterium]MXZ97853.1 sulfite exporter TauE/SafE family protein [Acidimicrobiaceae bacterium]MYE75561.1 sulfite exporter TauE/SafE family protein [Acidimicrobiaceae bacterium]MYE96759.1 sulfite exporter TauE/SafE family protein [Acidimicrobiaceae bacterium]MYH42457.1 sulfite exporter TauE/SafE family protein [Acidimicrobiaceae bacterium]
MSTTELIVVGVASGLAMLAKSATGLGYPLIAIPIVAAVVGVETAVVVVTLPNAVANLLVGWRTRHARSESRDVLVLSVTSAVGAVFGAFILVSAPERPLLGVLAATVLLFVVRSLWFGEATVSPSVGRRASPFVGAVTGVMQGAVGVSGPVIGSWLHAYRLPRDAYIFSLAVLFLLAGTAQTTTLASIGAYSGDRLVASAVGLGPVLAVLPLGEHLRTRLSGPQFDRAVLALLAASGVTLVVRAFTG